MLFIKGKQSKKCNRPPGFPGSYETDLAAVAIIAVLCGYSVECHFGIGTGLFIMPPDNAKPIDGKFSTSMYVSIPYGYWGTSKSGMKSTPIGGDVIGKIE